MQFTYLAAAACLAAVAAADSDYCPINQCQVSTSGTGWPNAYLRSNPCNNKAPIDTLYDGDTVYLLGTKPQNGCGYQYVQVLVEGNNGKNTVGWMSGQFVDCDNWVYGPPAPAPAAAASDTQG